MGDTSEREFLEKIVNVKIESSKRASGVIDAFAKMRKLKAESLKKTEEMLLHAEQDLEKLEQRIVSSKDLVPESKRRLEDEISTAKHQIKQKYSDLKQRIAAAITPE
jgi:hypothetical protein